MELHIEGQRIDVSEPQRVAIVNRLEKLNTPHQDIIHARVTLVKSRHHLHGSDEARIVLSMTRRKLLQVRKSGKTLDDAVSIAFEALQRELAEYRRRRREIDKQRLKTARIGPRVVGKVVHLVPEAGYGFIDIGADENVRFSRQVVVGEAFDDITEGTGVEVDVVEVGPGYEATRVVPLRP